MVSAPAAIGGKIFLFGKGAGDKAVYANVFDGKAWGAWTVLPGSGATNAPVAAVAKNKVVIFAKGAGDNKVYVNVWTP